MFFIFLTTFAWAGIIVGFALQWSPNPYIIWIGYGIAGTFCTMAYFIAYVQHAYIAAGVNIFFAAFNLYQFWKNRNDRKRRKKLQELGNKSKKIIKKMVDSLTPSPIPPPVRN